MHRFLLLTHGTKQKNHGNQSLVLKEVPCHDHRETIAVSYFNKAIWGHVRYMKIFNRSEKRREIQLKISYWVKTTVSLWSLQNKYCTLFTCYHVLFIQYIQCPTVLLFSLISAQVLLAYSTCSQPVEKHWLFHNFSKFDKYCS